MQWNLDEAIDYYKKQGAPSDQTALLGLLQEIQQESSGGIPIWTVEKISEKLNLKQSYLLAVIKRFPRLRLENTHCLELCAGLNCSKRAKLADFVEKTYGKNPPNFTVKFVPCMRMCGKGPNIKWDGRICHGADENLIRKLVEEI